MITAFETRVPERFSQIDRLEDRLCLTVLVATGNLPVDARIPDALEYWDDLGGCEDCPLSVKCLACIINQ